MARPRSQVVNQLTHESTEAVKCSRNSCTWMNLN